MLFYTLYTVGHKIGASFIFTITLANVDWTDLNNSFTFGFVDKLRNAIK